MKFLLAALASTTVLSVFLIHQLLHGFSSVEKKHKFTGFLSMVLIYLNFNFEKSYFQIFCPSQSQPRVVTVDSFPLKKAIGKRMTSSFFFSQLDQFAFLALNSPVENKLSPLILFLQLSSFLDGFQHLNWVINYLTWIFWWHQASHTNPFYEDVMSDTILILASRNIATVRN